MWKFVDDCTVQTPYWEYIWSVTQPTLNLIESWCSNNWMILNPIKCKELRICYLKRSVEFQPLTIAGRELEIVQSHKALGLTIQNNLKWDEHIRSIIAKGSKRSHVLRILRRSGILPADLIKIYSALIRSIWNIVAKFGVIRCANTILMNWKDSKDEQCVSYFLAIPAMKHWWWRVAND